MLPIAWDESGASCHISMAFLINSTDRASTGAGKPRPAILKYFTPASAKSGRKQAAQ